jgi:GxxExxY protein
MKDLKYKDITEKIIGGAFEVHKFLGNGFQEVIYQRALAYKMRIAGLEFNRKLNKKSFIKISQNPWVQEELILLFRKKSLLN